MSNPLSPADLIFPSAATSITSTFAELRRSNLTIANRLHSITHDATFVQRTATHFDLPLVANERCGSWYIANSAEGVGGGKAGSAYFKSTDGHNGEWAFSLRRLNLQVFDTIKNEGSGGCIIVDSTRRGKSTPDALSKTVPIWIAVLNTLLFPSHPTACELRTPEHVISRSEHAQISQRIPAFVQSARSLNLDLDGLRAKLDGKPMRAVWVTPDLDPAVATVEGREGWTTVVLCTASSRSSSAGSLGEKYVQGAADDSESWALGLDARTFWAKSERLLATSEEDLPAVIAGVIATSTQDGEVREARLIRPTSGIWIGSNATAERDRQGYDFVVSCSEKASPELAAEMKGRYLRLSCSSGKVGSRQLRAQLPKLERVETSIGPESKVLVTCHTGRDLAVGVALALICRMCDDAGGIKPDGAHAALSKTLTKHCLSWIMVSMPDASPSRATLQSVNAFLLG